MRIGIVDFSKITKKNDSLHGALQILGHDIFVVHHAEDWYNIVKSLFIKICGIMLILQNRSVTSTTQR